MKYCSKCKKIYINMEEKNCPQCNRKLIEEPSHFSPIHLITANGFEFERIRAAIDSAEIPYSYRAAKKEPGLMILNSAPPENIDIFVPLSDYDDAVNILVGIGAMKEDELADMDEHSQEQFKKAKKEAAEEELSPGKARIIRLLSAIGFLLALVGVSLLADFIAGLFGL